MPVALAQPGVDMAQAIVVRRESERCGREDSNLHPSRDQDLNLARMPISPRPQRQDRIPAERAMLLERRFNSLVDDVGLAID